MGQDTAELNAIRYDHVVTAMRNRDLDTARSLLTRLEADFPLDEDVLMWKAGVARTPADAVSALERVLSLNPKNGRALRTLSLVRSYGYEAAAESLSMTGPLLCCRVCGLKHAKVFQHCSACGSLHDISNLNGMLNNRKAIPRFLRQVVEDLEKRRSPDAAFSAAMGHLNLGQLREAAEQAGRSQERWPSEARFRIWREKLDGCRVILAIDASSVVLQAVEQVMGRRGFTVRTALDEAQALQILAGVKPELILFDNAIAGLPEALDRTRKQPGLRDVPHAVMAGNLLGLMRGKIGRAAAVLRKPFNAAELLAAAGSVIDLDARPEPRSWFRLDVEPPRLAESTPSNTAVRAGAGRYHPR